MVESVQVTVNELSGDKEGVMKSPVRFCTMVFLLVSLERHLPGIQIQQGIFDYLFRPAQGNQHKFVIVGNESLGMGILVKQEMHILGIAPASDRKSTRL